LLSKIPRPGRANLEKQKDQVSRSSGMPSKIPRLKRAPLNTLIEKNPDDDSLALKGGGFHKAKKKFSEFESETASASTPVATPTANVALVARNQFKVNNSVPAIVISPPNQTEIIPISPYPEKSGTKRRHDTNDTFQDVFDEQSKLKRARKRMPTHEDSSITSGTKEFDSQEVRLYRYIKKKPI
jgi:hypothetical protein